MPDAPADRGAAPSSQAAAPDAATASRALPRRRPLVWLGAAASVIAAGGFVAHAARIASQASSEVGEDEVGQAQPFAGPASAQAAAAGAGQRAPDFSFTALTGVGPLQGREGQTVKLSDFVGRPVWLNIFASWCAPCRAEMPDINSVYQDVQLREAQAGNADSLALLLVSIGEDPGVVRRYLDSARYHLPVLVDPTFAITERYRITGLPTHYFVDRAGVIRELAIGGLKPNAMRARLAKITQA